jgi:enterobactin synthetase component D
MLSIVKSPRLFGPDIACASVTFDPTHYADAMTFPFGVTIPATMSQAAPKRRAEYVAGRVCAAHATHALLGDFKGQIGSTTCGIPIWPEGLTGSITHSTGFASAALARLSDVRGLGLDTERIMSEEVMNAVGSIVCSAEEQLPAWLGLSKVVYTTLVFSAKESIFKCIDPLVGKMFWFKHVRFEIIDVTEGRFRITLSIDLNDEFRNGFALDGRFCVMPPYVHTGVLLAACNDEQPEFELASPGWNHHESTEPLLVYDADRVLA